MTTRKRTWLITGCSTGFGRDLASLLIARDEVVVATARHTDSLAELTGEHDHAHALKLDVTSAEDIQNVMAYVERELGGVDILVNNAGYGYLGAIEEGEEAAYRALFETNVFGLIEMTRAALPGMRIRGYGHIVNIASVGGLVGNPGSAYYAGTKFAVVGMSEALSKEVEPLGIKVTVVAPGPFRTDWAGRSLKIAENRIPAYEDTVHQRIEQIANMSGTQAGDPVRASEAIITAVDSEHPPLHLILGEVGLHAVRTKLTALHTEIDRWESITLGADFPK